MDVQVQEDLSNMPTEQAGGLQGSVSTAAAEAAAIIPAAELEQKLVQANEQSAASGETAADQASDVIPQLAQAQADKKDYVKHMGDPYASVTGRHSDDIAEADAIVNNAVAEINDVTGKAGATLYAAASDADAPQSAYIRGSVPNYRAESKLITSGTSGNFEKSLENDPVMTVAGGKTPARQVGSKIIDEAVKDHSNNVDCTGTVDTDGKHGVGRGKCLCCVTCCSYHPHAFPLARAPPSL
jgi:hypothetical protein